MFKTLVSVAISFAVMVGTLYGFLYSQKPNYDLFQQQTVRVIFANPDQDRGKMLCSGVYIGDRRVLTAGHCAQFVTPNVVAYVQVRGSEEKFYATQARGAYVTQDSGLPVSDLGELVLERELPTPPARPSCRIPELGEELYAVGMPQGLNWTITRGYVTTWIPRGDLDPERWLQLDMTILSGNSGGPVFDRDGRLVGIISHGMTTGMLGAPTGHNYAVSSKVICEFLER